MRAFNVKFIPVLGAVAGVALGLAAYRAQPANLMTMNEWGVVAFASLGTSLGCLWTGARTTPRRIGR